MENVQQHNLYEFDDLTDFKKSIEENMIEEINLTKKLVKSLKTKNTLNKKFWENDELKPIIRKKLIHIAKDFIKQLELPKGTYIKDIILTGSIANFNWSNYSDVDLHIILDFNQLQGDPNIIKNFFQAKKNIWNEKHNIKIFNHDVELYAQDTKEPHHSSAIYSVLFDKWIKKPSKEKYSIDIPKIKEKLNSFENYLKIIKNYYNSNKFIETINLSKKLKDKIKNMRKIALEKYGESATENLIFKILRRTDFMEQLDIYKSNAYDKLMSINENSYRTLIKQKLHEMFVKKDDEEINIPYSDAEELKQARGYSIKKDYNPQKIFKEIEDRIKNAESVNSEYMSKNKNDKYFMSPSDGYGYYQVKFSISSSFPKAEFIRPSADMEQKSFKFRPTPPGDSKHHGDVNRYCFVQASTYFLTDGTRIPENVADYIHIMIEAKMRDDSIKNKIDLIDTKNLIDKVSKLLKEKEVIPKDYVEKIKLIDIKKSYTSSPAEDAATKALFIFKNEIIDYYNKGSYITQDAEKIAIEKIGEKGVFEANLKKILGHISPRVIEIANELKDNPKYEVNSPIFKQNDGNNKELPYEMMMRYKESFAKYKIIFDKRLNKLDFIFKEYLSGEEQKFSFDKIDINEYIFLKEFFIKSKGINEWNKFVELLDDNKKESDLYQYVDKIFNENFIKKIDSDYNKGVRELYLINKMMKWGLSSFDKNNIEKIKQPVINAYFKYKKENGREPTEDEFREIYYDYVQKIKSNLKQYRKKQ